MNMWSDVYGAWERELGLWELFLTDDVRKSEIEGGSMFMCGPLKVSEISS